MLRRFRSRGLSVRARLGLIQVLLIGALLLIGLTCWQVIQQQRDTGAALALLSKAERLHLNADMMHDALNANVNTALRVPTRNSAMAGEVLASARENAHQYELDLEQIEALPLPAEVESVFAAAQPGAMNYIAQASMLVDTALRSQKEALALEPAFNKAFDELLKANRRVSLQLAAQMEMAEKRSADQAAAARTWIVATSILTMAIAWICVALISQSIRGSLRQVSDAARALAAGNLSVRSEVASQDEVGELAGSLNKMADDLQNMIDRLLSDADRDAFAAQLMQALEMAENERDVHAVIARAMSQVSADLAMEMLLAGHEQSELNVVAEHPQRGRPGCGVDSLGGCVAIRRGAAMVFGDSDALNACPRLRERPTGPVSAVCVPVTFMGHSLGVLHVAGAARKEPSPKQVAQITALGMQAGGRIGAVRAFARAQLHAYTDVLTGLANRRAMESAIDELQGGQTPYAFALADLDHFKRLNDTFGHDVGDKALRLFADVLTANVRQADKAARWGGEEFAILFQGSTAAQAAEVLERIRVGLAESLLVTGGPVFTSSFGISDSTMAASFERVIRLADEALYLSKEQGRDRISLATSVLDEEETGQRSGESA